MKLSKKSDYALRALVALTDHRDQGVLSIRTLSAENDIPKRFLEQIMMDLREQGWVRGIPGRDGGYALAVAPESVTMGQVVRVFDGVLAPIGCVSVTNYEPCSQEKSCRFRRVLMEVRNFTARQLDNLSLLDLTRGKPVSTLEVLNRQFMAGDGI